MKPEKKKKEKFVDDGRVIAPMDNEYITGYKSKAQHPLYSRLREARISRLTVTEIFRYLHARDTSSAAGTQRELLHPRR